MTRDDVAGELADIVAGNVTIRPGSDDVVVFDSTGLAIQDVAAAVVIYERATAAGTGRSMTFA